MDPLTVTAALTAAVLAGTAPAAWRLHRRAHRVEAHAARLRGELQAEYHAANHDPLTGLPNRRGFFRHGNALLANRAGHPLAAVVLDLDDFKQLNDRYGHAVGDQVLVTIAERFAAWAAQTCGPPAARRQVVARLGGDEFAGLLTAASSDHRWARHAADRLRVQLAVPMTVSGHRLRLTASVGITLVPPATSLTEALRHADAAMYHTKANGYRRPANGRGPA